MTGTENPIAADEEPKTATIAAALGIALVTACGLVAYARGMPAQMPEPEPDTTYTVLNYKNHYTASGKPSKWWTSWNLDLEGLVIIATTEKGTDVVMSVQTGACHSPVFTTAGSVSGSISEPNNDLFAKALAYLYTTQTEADVGTLTAALCATRWYGEYLNEDIDIGQARVARLDGWVDFAGALVFKYQRGDAEARLLRSNSKFTNLAYAEQVESTHKSTRGTKRAAVSVASIACPVFAAALAVAESPRPLVACAIVVSALAAIGYATDVFGANGGGVGGVIANGGAVIANGGAVGVVGATAAALAETLQLLKTAESGAKAAADALVLQETALARATAAVTALKLPSTATKAVERYLRAIAHVGATLVDMVDMAAASGGTRAVVSAQTDLGSATKAYAEAQSELKAAEADATTEIEAFAAINPNARKAYADVIAATEIVVTSLAQIRIHAAKVVDAAGAVLVARGVSELVVNGAKSAVAACARALDAQIVAADAAGAVLREVNAAEQSAAERSAEVERAAEAQRMSSSDPIQAQQHPDATPMRTFGTLSFASKGLLRAIETGEGVDRAVNAFERASRAVSEAVANSNDLKEVLVRALAGYKQQRMALHQKLQCDEEVARTSNAKAAAFEAIEPSEPALIEAIDAPLRSRASVATHRQRAVPWSNFGSGAYSLNAYKDGKMVYTKQDTIPRTMFQSTSEIVKSVNEFLANKTLKSAPVEVQHDPVTNALFLVITSDVATSAAFAIDPYGPGGDSMACTKAAEAYTWIDLDANAALYVAAASLSPSGVIAKLAKESTVAEAYYTAAVRAKVLLEDALERLKPAIQSTVEAELMASFAKRAAEVALESAKIRLEAASDALGTRGAPLQDPIAVPPAESLRRAETALVAAERAHAATDDTLEAATSATDKLAGSGSVRSVSEVRAARVAYVAALADLTNANKAVVDAADGVADAAEARAQNASAAERKTLTTLAAQARKNAQDARGAAAKLRVTVWTALLRREMILRFQRVTLSVTRRARFLQGVFQGVVIQEGRGYTLFLQQQDQ
jgi:hypothetical protein